jgi:predicted transcriptional regulator YdeE
MPHPADGTLPSNGTATPWPLTAQGCPAPALFRYSCQSARCSGITDIVRRRDRRTMKAKFEQLDTFSIIGCPQYANPRVLCPGDAWNRLNKLRKEYGINEHSELAFAIEVYPPDIPDNDFMFYYMAGILLKDAPLEIRDHLFIKEVPAANYAVFPVEDNNTDNIKESLEFAYKTLLRIDSVNI